MACDSSQARSGKDDFFNPVLSFINFPPEHLLSQASNNSGIQDCYPALCQFVIRQIVNFDNEKGLCYKNFAGKNESPTETIAVANKNIFPYKHSPT